MVGWSVNSKPTILYGLPKGTPEPLYDNIIGVH